LARPRAHLAVSLGLAALQWLRTRRSLPTIAPLVSGFLIDADHLLDYYLHRSSPSGRSRRVFLALHGWEFLLLVALLEMGPLRRLSAHGLTLGWLAHLTLDQLTNESRHPLTYSILFRWARGFRADLFTGRAGLHTWRDAPVRKLWRWL
jgi:hypothetical protein